MITRWLDPLLTDVRHGVRRLRRRPGFAWLAIVLFGVGIGINVALFSIADAVLLGPLPFDRPGELYAVWPERNFNKQMADLAESELASWQAVAAYSMPWAYPVSGDGVTTEHVATTLVSTNFFDVVGIEPRLGALFRPEHSDPGQDVVVLSYEYWQRHFGGDESAIGATLRVDGRSRQVLGVLPPGSRLLGRVDELWLPYPVDRASNDFVSSFYLKAVGRLAPAATPQSAAAELASFSRRLAADNPIYTLPEAIGPPTVAPFRSVLFGASASLLQALALATGAVLLLACANVAHLILVQTESRSKELALLAALGAGKVRLVRSILAETLALGLAGGGLGWLVAVWSRGLLAQWLPPGVPRRADLVVDGRALLISVLLALVVTTLAALLPARHALGLRLAGGLRSRRGVSATGGAQRWLVTLEVAAVLTLVMTATLLGRSLQRLSAVDPGVDVGRAVTLRVHPPSDGRDDAQLRGLYDQLLARLGAIPGVTAVGGIQLLPLAGDGNWAFPYLAQGAPLPDGPLPEADFRVVTPGYAAAAGLNLLAGRDFDFRDGAEGAAAGWVDRTMAERLWPGEQAVGKVIQLFGNQPFTVVGVVEDVRQLGLERAPRPTMYRPMAQFTVPSLHLVVRTAGDVAGLAPVLRTAVAEVAPDVAVASVRPFAEVVRASVATPRFTAVLTGSFAALALFLGWCGIFAVLAHVVQSRRGEIGIRLALGAGTRRIEAEVLRTALAMAGRGVVLGALLALLAGWSLRSQLFDVEAWDPAALALAVAAALSAVMLGTWWPARRAASVDPAEVLRAE